MSISADPKATAEFECVSLTGKTIELRARFLTSAERKRHMQIIATRIEGKLPEDKGVQDATREAIELGIVGTTFAQLEEHLTPRELCRLAIRYIKAIDLTEIELGKSTSLLRFTADKSAATVPAAAATTNPAPSAP